MLENGREIRVTYEQFYKDLYSPHKLSELDFDMIDNVWRGPYIDDETS